MADGISAEDNKDNYDPCNSSSNISRLVVDQYIAVDSMAKCHETVCPSKWVNNSAYHRGTNCYNPKPSYCWTVQFSIDCNWCYMALDEKKNNNKNIVQKTALIINVIGSLVGTKGFLGIKLTWFIFLTWKPKHITGTAAKTWVQWKTVGELQNRSGKVELF